MRRSVLVVVALALGAHTRPAHAELRELAARVADAYKVAGARVVVLPTRFLYEDETLTLAAPDAAGAKCTTIAIIGARGLSFHVGTESDDESERAYGVAGALEVDTCEPRAASVRVRSDAGRGAIEIVVAYSQSRLPPLRVVLPERVGGSLPATVDPGPVPALPAPDKRADAAEASSRRDGAVVLPRAMAVASDNGTGLVHVRLERGCHRIELFSPESHAGRRKSRLDVDAELHDESGDTLLARDRGEAADARLDVCASDGKDTLLSFGGAPAGAPIIIARASWSMPAAVPTVWGAEASRRMAGALRARHVTPQHPAVALVEGVVGSTSIVERVEPGACYVAIVAATRGTPRGLVLRTLVGGTEHADERGTAEGAALTSFCTGPSDRVRMSIEARGTSLAWGLALFHMTSGGWEVRP